jgi:hypothetical protein
MTVTDGQHFDLFLSQSFTSDLMPASVLFTAVVQSGLFL